MREFDHSAQHYPCQTIEKDELEAYFSSGGVEFSFVEEGTKSVWLDRKQVRELYNDLKHYLIYVGDL